MGIYSRLGISPIINAAGTLTRLGGTIMRSEVRQSMADAAESLVPIEQLQAAASRSIAEVCGSEAGYIVSGAAAGLTMATAACMVGLDITKMDMLPFPRGVPDEVIICRSHRNSYDHAYRAAGAALVEIGVSDRLAGAGVRDTELWEIESAITDKTAAIAYTAMPHSLPSLQQIKRTVLKYDIPVIVDGAAQLPPPSNLRRFINEGADLVCFSGGKALRGPQATGIIAGRRDLIASIALQHLDMDVTDPLWNPPSDLIPKEKLKGIPRHGIGRGFKVSKEQIVGAITALGSYTEGQCERDQKKWQAIVHRVEQGLKAFNHIRLSIEPLNHPHSIPILQIQIEEDVLGKSALEIASELNRGNPPVYVGEKHIFEGMLLVNPINLDDAGADEVVKRLADILNG